MNKNKGVVQISDDVLVAIIQTATMETEGVYSINTSLASEIIGKLGKKTCKGVSIHNENKEMTINISLTVKLNFKMVDVAKNVQDKVKNAIESMTGITVSKVNINIVSVEAEKENKE